jgi:hypothetical protein
MKQTQKILQRLEEAIKILKYNNIIKTNQDIVNDLGYNKSTISSILKGRYPVSHLFIDKFCNTYKIINKNCLLTGEGEMIYTEISESKKKRIPLYSDAVTIGGANEMAASVEGTSKVDEWIDTGDWFRDATAAVRHYGNSMIEYPSGCILALKEVCDRTLIIPGRDYVIETNEYRVTKRIKLNKNKTSITAYSTNEEKFDDGTLIHEPFEIEFNAIHKIFLVLGYVVKNFGSGIVYSKK